MKCVSLKTSEHESIQHLYISQSENLDITSKNSHLCIIEFEKDANLANHMILKAGNKYIFFNIKYQIWCLTKVKLNYIKLVLNQIENI